MNVYNKPVYVTRFTNDTYSQCREYNNKHSVGTEWIYNTSSKLSKKVTEQFIYVFEMNNSTNTIVGVSRVSTDMHYRKHKMYDDMNASYNMYSYKCTRRIDRKNISRHVDTILTKLEKLIFYTKSHIKRGSGIQGLPQHVYSLCMDRCESSLYDTLDEMFEERAQIKILLPPINRMYTYDDESDY